MNASKYSRTNRMARGFSGQLRGCSSSLVRHGPLTDPRSPLWFRVASPPQRRVAAQRERQSGCARSRAFFDPAASTAATPLLVALRFDSESTAGVWYYLCVCKRRASYIEIAAGVLGRASRLHFQVEVFPSPFCIPCMTKRYRYLSRA